MHIFNLNDRPYFILTNNELLFRCTISDEEMQRYAFDEVEKISIEHKSDENKELLFFFKIKILAQKSPFLLSFSALDTPIEELISILSEELPENIELSLPAAKPIQHSKNRSNKVALLLAILLFFIGLNGTHILLIPSLQSLDDNALKMRYEQESGLCSARAKAAFTSSQGNMLEVKYYCGVAGLWKESSSKTISKEYLEAEFSALDFSGYIQQAKESLDNNKSTEAINQIENALYLNPKSAQAYLLLSTVQNRLGLAKKALASLLKAASLNPESSSIAASLASLYLQEKDFAEAYIYAKKAAMLETNAANLVKVAKIETILDKTDQAIKHYELSLHKDPDNLKVLTELSIFYRKQQDFIKAAEKLQKVYTLDPDKALNFLNYYEMTCITPSRLGQKDENDFVEKNRDSKEAMMIYDMLQIIRLAIESSDIQDALALWTKNYENERLVWSFESLRGWLDASQLHIDQIQNIQSAIGFFIGYQQAYKINHNEGNL